MQTEFWSNFILEDSLSLSPYINTLLKFDAERFVGKHACFNICQKRGSINRTLNLQLRVFSDFTHLLACEHQIY